MNREKILETAIKAAVSAGNLLVEHFNDLLTVSVKESLRDIVTEVDMIAENRIVDILFDFDKNLPVIAEERGDSGGVDRDEYWVVDALDGTVNYVNRIPHFAVSVAFVKKDKPLVGVIYNPTDNNLYYGAEGIGVFKNQRKISVKDKAPGECLFAMAFSGKNYDPERRPEEFLLFGEINDSSRGCLRTGSAAMNLALLAEGKLGGCVGKANKWWDVAAGLVIARLAGARLQYAPVDSNEYLVSYLAAVPAAWEYGLKKSSRILGR